MIGPARALRACALPLLLLPPWLTPRAGEIDFHVTPALGAPFATRHLPGVFVAFGARTGTWSTNDPVRARARFLPASTFKIPNSLIALEVGSVATVDTNLKWDGVDRGSPGWNCDQSMRVAIQRSTVWFYQEMARRTGEARMAEWVRKIHYGNADARAWSEAPLRIAISYENLVQVGALPAGTVPPKT